MDKWDGYAASRQRLYARLQETKAPNPIVLSGDVHVHYGADLKMDYTNPKSEIVGVELTNSSATSGGDGAEVSGNWDAIARDNPHIKYHSARRGYIACTATPESHARRTSRCFDRVTVPGRARAQQAGRSWSEAGLRSHRLRAQAQGSGNFGLTWWPACALRPE